MQAFSKRVGSRRCRRVTVRVTVASAGCGLGVPRALVRPISSLGIEPLWLHDDGRMLLPSGDELVTLRRPRPIIRGAVRRPDYGANS